MLKPPEDKLRRLCFDVSSSDWWEGVSSTCIIINVFVMMAEYRGQADWYTTMMDNINLGFLIFFTVEMFMKLAGFGFLMYWEDAWNKFDCIVVVFSWLGLVFNFNAQVARAFRAFRIALFLKSARGLRSLFTTLIKAIPPSARPSLIPSPCTHLTRAGIERRRCHHAVCMTWPCKGPRHSGQPRP